jgi:hypothetical protein
MPLLLVVHRFPRHLFACRILAGRRQGSGLAIRGNHDSAAGRDDSSLFVFESQCVIVNFFYERVSAEGSPVSG